jgi:hypothetical protein
MWPPKSLHHIMFNGHSTVRYSSAHNNTCQPQRHSEEEDSLTCNFTCLLNSAKYVHTVLFTCTQLAYTPSHIHWCQWISNWQARLQFLVLWQRKKKSQLILYFLLLKSQFAEDSGYCALTSHLQVGCYSVTDSTKFINCSSELVTY